MGMKLATCNHCGCGQCEQCICAKGERCASLCQRAPPNKAVIQTLAAVQDDAPAPRPERYQLLGADCSVRHFICSDLGPPLLPGEHYLDEGIPSCFDPVDQVLVQERGGSSASETHQPRNMSERRDIVTLEDECRYNPSKVEKIKELEKDYTHWRHIRGDGNCFYRAVIVGALEVILEQGNRPRWEKMIASLEQVSYDDKTDQEMHERLLQHLRQCLTPMQFEEKILQEDTGVDKALIRASRKLTRTFLIDNPREISMMTGSAGLNLDLLIPSVYDDMEAFCKNIVDPMGTCAEMPAVEALPAKLGIGMRVWMLDRLDKVPLACLDRPNEDGLLDVHVLLKPGHYDLLYWKNRPPKADMPLPEPMAQALLEDAVEVAESLPAFENYPVAMMNAGTTFAPGQSLEVYVPPRNIASLPPPVPCFMYEAGLVDGAGKLPPLLPGHPAMGPQLQHAPRQPPPTLLVDSWGPPASSHPAQHSAVAVRPALTYAVGSAGQSPVYAPAPVQVHRNVAEAPTLPTLCTSPMGKMRADEKPTLQRLQPASRMASPQRAPHHH